VSYETEPSPFLGQGFGPRRNYAEETAREIDVAVRRIVEAQFRRAREILARNRALLEEGARTLLDRETLADADLAAVLSRVGPEEPRLAAASAVGVT